MLHKALETIKKYDMLREGDSVLVGVSGGADSLALMHLLCSLRQEWGLKVFAAHINHGLRGEEAERDEAHVIDFCKNLDAELFILKANVKDEAQKAGESTEEAGRRIRYEYFERVASGHNARIATAHTLSDSMETVLFNLARGAGLKGLCGIPPVRGGIIRPLINCTRRETEAYCKDNGIIYVNDSTNFTREYTRNKIRLDLMPLLYELNPSLDKAVSRLTDSLSEDNDLLTALAEQKLKEAEISENRFSVPVILDCHRALQKRVIRLGAKAVSHTEQESGHTDDILAILSGGGKIQIKGGCYAEVHGDVLSFSMPELTPKIQDILPPFSEGDFDFNGFSLKINHKLVQDIKNLKNIQKQYLNNSIDCAKIKGNVIIRTRIDGDRFKPVGRGITKTLKKLFNESSVPLPQRELIPVISDSEGILWVGGFGADERCAMTESTNEFYNIDFKSLE